MNIKNIRNIIALVAYSFVSQLYASELTISNTFQSGTPARAADVNQNFSDIAASVNDNDNRITTNTTSISTLHTKSSTLVMDGDNQEIGSLVDITDDYDAINIMTQKNYIISQIGLLTGTSRELHRLFYATSDCTGTPYARYTFNGAIILASNSSGVESVYYIDKGRIGLTSFTYSSNSTESGCFAVSGTVTGGLWPASPNDPAVTGVTNIAFNLPITFEQAQ